MTVNNFRHWFVRFLTVLIVFAFVINLILLPSQIRAYRSLPQDAVKYPKLPGAVTSMYIFYDHLNSTLGIQNSGGLATHAINQWDASSRYTMFSLLSGGSVTQNTNRILAVDFLYSMRTTPCGSLYGAYLVRASAFTCTGETSIYLNTYGYTWNTSGLDGAAGPFSWTCLCNTIYADFFSQVLHELGHVFGLAHPQNAPNSTNSVMHDGPGLRSSLTADDQSGLVQIYGPYTGWDTGITLGWFPGYSYNDSQGSANWIAYQKDVTSAQLIPGPAQNGVAPYSGNRYIALSGTANNNYSYAYMKLFSADNDELGSNPRHLTIKNGTTLSWHQYNYAQSRMTVDITFSDGTTLRDSGLKDQNNICVHPACRGSYGTGAWYYFTVNLSSLAGKRVKDIMIAYDNGNNGPTGSFRAYFDDLHIDY